MARCRHRRVAPEPAAAGARRGPEVSVGRRWWWWRQWSSSSGGGGGSVVVVGNGRQIFGSSLGRPFGPAPPSPTNGVAFFRHRRRKPLVVSTTTSAPNATNDHDTIRTATTPGAGPRFVSAVFEMLIVPHPLDFARTAPHPKRSDPKFHGGVTGCPGVPGIKLQGLSPDYLLELLTPHLASIRAMSACPSCSSFWKPLTLRVDCFKSLAACVPWLFWSTTVSSPASGPGAWRRPHRPFATLFSWALACAQSMALMRTHDPPDLHVPSGACGFRFAGSATASSWAVEPVVVDVGRSSSQTHRRVDGGRPLIPA